MPNTFQEDYEVGKKNETDVLPILKTFFADETIRNTLEQMDRSDFVGKKKYEMKSRDLLSTSSFAEDGLLIDVGKTMTNDIIIWNLLDKIVYLESEDILGGVGKLDIHTNKIRKDEPKGSRIVAKVYKVPISKTKLLYTYSIPRSKKPSKCLISLSEVY